MMVSGRFQFVRSVNGEITNLSTDASMRARHVIENLVRRSKFIIFAARLQTLIEVIQCDLLGGVSQSRLRARALGG